MKTPALGGAIPILCALVISSLTACAAGRRAQATDPSGSPPHSMRVEMKGRLDWAGDTFRFEASLAMLRPDQLYAELGGPVGGRRAILSASSGRLVVLFIPRREYIDEEATPDLWEELLGLRLSTEELVDLLGSAGRNGSRTVVSRPDALGRSVSLQVTSLENRMTVEPAGDNPSALRRMELRVTRVDAGIDAGSLDKLFDPIIPAGWRRLAPASRGGGSPSLFP